MATAIVIMVFASVTMGTMVRIAVTLRARVIIAGTTPTHIAKRARIVVLLGWRCERTVSCIRKTLENHRVTKIIRVKTMASVTVMAVANVLNRSLATIVPSKIAP